MCIRDSLFGIRHTIESEIIWRRSHLRSRVEYFREYYLENLSASITLEESQIFTHYTVQQNRFFCMLCVFSEVTSSWLIRPRTTISWRFSSHLFALWSEKRLEVAKQGGFRHLRCTMPVYSEVKPKERIVIFVIWRHFHPEITHNDVVNSLINKFTNKPSRLNFSTAVRRVRNCGFQ